MGSLLTAADNTPEIRNRTLGRTFVAMLVALVVAAGAWGANTAFRLSADEWPTTPLDLAQLVAVTLLLGVGMLACFLVLGRLVGYKRRLEKERQEELARLEQAASTDKLTGLGNRRAFYEDLKREIARRSRSGAFFSLVMLDLDGLKEINDTLGHPAGDERIRAVAACLQATVRGSDGAYRTGGDEFMALLPGELAW